MTRRHGQAEHSEGAALQALAADIAEHGGALVSGNFYNKASHAFIAKGPRELLQRLGGQEKNLPLWLMAAKPEE